MMDHGFDDDDGIVHHDPDSQHKSEHGQGVNGKSEYREKDERSDKGNRDRDQRNDRRTQVLKEDKNNKSYEYKSLDKCFYDLVDRSFDRRSSVVHHLVVHIRGKYGFLVLQHFIDRFS